MNGLQSFLAQVRVDASDVGLPSLFAGDRLFNSIVGLIYTIIAAVALFYIVRAAVLFVTSGSDPGSVKDARETILYAVVALFGSTVVFGVIQFIATRIG